MSKNAGVTDDRSDARWPRLLSLAVHEFRTPITVVAGYLRMVLKERAGPITDQQRKLLEEADKSCGRLSALVAEMSDLAGLEGGAATFNRAQVDLSAVLREVVAGLPDLPDRTVSVVLEGTDTRLLLPGDATRLRTAFTSLLMALIREVVASDRLIVRVDRGRTSATTVLAIGDPAQIDAISAADPASLDRFDEWRGGSGLGLAVARRILGQHGGTIFSPPGGGKAGALVILPLS